MLKRLPAIERPATSLTMTGLPWYHNVFFNLAFLCLIYRYRRPRCFELHCALYTELHVTRSPRRGLVLSQHVAVHSVALFQTAIRVLTVGIVFEVTTTNVTDTFCNYIFVYELLLIVRISRPESMLAYCMGALPLCNVPPCHFRLSYLALHLSLVHLDLSLCARVWLCLRITPDPMLDTSLGAACF
jgi:hypothetical protein